MYIFRQVLLTCKDVFISSIRPIRSASLVFRKKWNQHITIHLGKKRLNPVIQPLTKFSSYVLFKWWTIDLLLFYTKTPTSA